MMASRKSKSGGKPPPRKAPSCTRQGGIRRLLGAGSLLFIFALSIRLLFLFDMSESPTFHVPVVDSFVYHQAAVSLVRGQGFQDTFFFQPFFYPFFLSAVYAVSGVSILAAKLIQALIGAMTCVLVLQLGRRVFGKTAGLIAGLMAAVYSPLIFFESELLATGPAAFESIALVILFLKARESRSPFFFFFFGLFCAICVLTRPTFLPVIVVGAAWLFICFFRSMPSRPAIVPLLGVALFGFLLPASAVAWINREQTGHMGFLPSSSGLNFYLGNNSSYEETVNARMGSEWSELLHLPEAAHVPDDDWSRSRFYWSQALEYAVSDPLDFASGMGRKALQIVSSREIPRNVDIYLFRKWSWMLRCLLWKAGGFGFPFGLLFPLAMVGWFLNRRRIPFVLRMSLVVYSLSVVAVFVTARYRIPMIPLLAMLAAAGVTGAVQAIREKRMKRISAAALVLAGAVLLGTLPGPFVAERMDYEAELHGCIGDSLRRSGRIDEAVEQFQQAIRLDPGNAEALADLAQLYAARGEINGAVEACRAALKHKPGMIRAISNLGSLLSDQGNHDEAVRVCRQGLELRPHDAALHFNLAKALAGKG
ncbi:MAG: tetratricopeptide repeat protein, partial [Planctomycetota bacterium]